LNDFKSEGNSREFQVKLANMIKRKYENNKEKLIGIKNNELRIKGSKKTENINKIKMIKLDLLA
jgi:hypothetical protein